MARYFLIVISCCLLAVPAWSQFMVYSQHIQVLDSSEKREPLVKYWQRRGYQIDSYALMRDSLVLLFSDFTVLTKALKKKKDMLIITSAKGEKYRLTRDAVFEQIWHQQFAREKPYSEKNFKRILKDRKKVPGRNRKGYFLYFGKAESLSKKLELIVTHKKKELLRVTFTGHETDFITDVPYLELVNCKTVDVWTSFKKYFMRELATNFVPLRPIVWQKKTREYRLYFEQGKAGYDPETTNSIIQFMEDSNMVVKGADIEAFSSIEGSYDVNKALQEKRAGVFIQTLQRSNGDTIPYRLKMAENWELFQEQLANSGIPDTLNHEEWKVVAGRDPGFERLLSQQRYARIKLYFIQKELPANSGFMISDRLRQTKYSYRPARSDAPEYLRRAEMKKLSTIMSMKRFLYDEVAAGRLDAKYYCEAINGTESWAMRLVMLNFYDEVKRFDADSCHCDMQQLAINTFKSAFDQYDQNDPFSRKNLEDVHTFIVSRIISGDFSPELACDIVVPDDPAYYRLTLNNLRLLNEQVRKPALQPSCSTFDELYRELLEQGTPGKMEGSSLAKPKEISFELISADDPDEPVSTLHSDSRYYYLLKTNVLNGGGLRPYVDRTHWSFDFDVFELMEVNVWKWDVVNDSLFDEDVDVKTMHEIFRIWIPENRRYCRNDVLYIASLFYSKIVLRSIVSREKHPLLDYATGFLESLFLTHRDLVRPNELVQLSRFLLMSQAFYFSNERMRFYREVGEIEVPDMEKRL